MTDETQEFNERCNRAVKELTVMAGKSFTEYSEQRRLLGKIEGVKLAQSHANEMLAARLSALQTAAEKDGRKIEQALVSLESIGLIAIAKCNVCVGPCNHDAFFQDIALIAQTTRALLAATAPVEGEAK